MKIYGTFLDVMEAVFTFISRNLYVIEVILLSKEVIEDDWSRSTWGVYEVSVQMWSGPVLKQQQSLGVGVTQLTSILHETYTEILGVEIRSRPG